jgi:4-amino-4-deoxy-L-arabinose transferase-like glycosyltransferase
MPNSFRRGPWQEGLILALVTISLFAVFLLTTRSIGLSADEWAYFIHGDKLAAWYLRLPEELLMKRNWQFLSPAALAPVWQENKEHPPLTKLMIGLSQVLFGRITDRIIAYRALVMLEFCLFLAAMYLILRRWFAWPVAFFSPLCLLLMPCLFGQAHFGALDVPMLVMHFLAAGTFWLSFTEKGKNRRFWLYIAFGICYGLALLSKINAIFLPIPFFGLAWLYFRRRWFNQLLAILGLSLPIFLLGWPRLWFHPLNEMIDYILYYTRHVPIPLYYLGKLYFEKTAPWHYPLVMTLVTVPGPILGLFFTGLVRMFRNRLRQPVEGFMLANLLFPMLLLMSPGASKYDGIRLFISAFPYLAIIAGMGFDWLFARWYEQKWILALLLAIFLIPPALTIAWYHPYEPTGYYNALIGGPKGAIKAGFETSTWHEPINLEVVEYINRYFEPHAVVELNWAAGSLMTYQYFGYLRSDILFKTVGRYHVLICQQSSFDGEYWWNLYYNKNPDYRLVKEFTLRNGVPMVQIFNRTPLAEQFTK